MRATGRVLFLAMLACAFRASAEETITPPTADCPPPPTYPESEVGSRVTGAVGVTVTLDVTGHATAVVSTPLGPAFDALALATVQQCRFTPAKRGETPAPATMEISVAFTPPPLPARLEGELVGELGAALPGAQVRLGSAETTSDENGRFSLEVPVAEGGSTLPFSVEREGYAPVQASETLQSGEKKSVNLRLPPRRPYEAHVTGTRLLPPLPKLDPTPSVSRFEITRADIDRTPGALEDVNRVVATLPGVVADPDLMATLFVRGGGPDEVVFYLDGVPLSNPFHLGGFASIYNPMLVDSAEFYAGGMPAQYEPTLSGVLDVRYLGGDATRPRVMADVSMNTAKVMAETPTGIDGLSAMVAARRSYYELYFAGLRALHIAGADYVAPEIGEYTARLHYRRGRHEVTGTYLHSTDGLSFLVRPGEQLLVNFAGGLSIENTLDLGIVQDRIDLGDARNLRLLVAGTREANDTQVASETSFARHVTRFEGLARADLTLPFGERHRFLTGLSYSHRRYDFTGQVADTRGDAPWESRPIVDTGAPQVDVNPASREEFAAVYADETFQLRPGIALEAGARLQMDFLSQLLLYSARAGGSWELPTHGVAKVSAGVTTQPAIDPLLLDAKLGNPSLPPQRSRQLVFGIEQPLPIKAFVRVEAWAKWLDRLAANPDTAEGVAELEAAGKPVFQSVGTGFARGADLLFAGRTTLWSYGLSAGLVWSDRTNPLAKMARTYPTAWDQRFTLAANAGFTPGAGWLVSARFSFHTGRPYTPVTGFVRDEANQRFLPVFGTTDSARYPAYYEASVRAEKRFHLGSFPMAWYAEVLNVTNASNVYAYLYDAGDFARGVEPTRGEFLHLPIRPFLGIRGEY